MAKGTKEDPWALKTPPGTSGYTMYKEKQAEPPALVCQVGSTTLRYQVRAIEDLHAWLVEQGDWVAQAGRGRHGRGLGTVPRQPGWRLVRVAEGLPRPLWDVPPAIGGARPGRSHPRGS